MSAQAALLSDGRLHLQHGPIDCLCRAEGPAEEIRRAYAQAVEAFPAILPALCAELPLLRTRLPAPLPNAVVGRAMHRACLPYAERFITPMAAVAGAVADHLLAALVRGRHLRRAFVNNGGDIAFHLAPGERLRCGMVTDLAAPAIDAALRLDAGLPARGVATSGRACKGRGGRSFSLGIADAVTVLAPTAAEADAAATVIANAVDLPAHPSVVRRPAAAIDPDSDLGAIAVTWTVGPLASGEIDRALAAGHRVAEHLVHDGRILAAALALRGRMMLAGGASEGALQMENVV